MPAWISADAVQSWIGQSTLTPEAAASLAQVASDALRMYLERDLAVGTFSEWYDANGTNYILLNHWPVRSIASVSYNGQSISQAIPTPGQSTAPQGWTLDPFIPRKLSFGMGQLPRATMAIAVNGLVAGYDVQVDPGSSPTALPGHIFHALRLICSAVYNSQAADPNLTGESIAGVFSGSFVPVGVGSIPPGAMTLVQNERRAAP